MKIEKHLDIAFRAWEKGDPLTEFQEILTYVHRERVIDDLLTILSGERPVERSESKERNVAMKHWSFDDTIIWASTAVGTVLTAFAIIGLVTVIRYIVDLF